VWQVCSAARGCLGGIFAPRRGGEAGYEPSLQGGPFGIPNGSRNNAFVDFADAAAHNEEVFRSINERIEEGAKQHGVEQLLPFHCECATEACLETIELPPAEYDRVASHRARFVVVPGHEHSNVETVVERHSAYLVVEKTGEARAEIEREHPRPRHQG
jgi:hypothetical protein